MDTQNIYLARQPVVDRDNQLVGFELLFRLAAAGQPGKDVGIGATSAGIAHAFAEMGIDKVIGTAIGFINVDTEFLGSALIEALPADRIVLELDEDQINDDATLRRCAELRRRGYRVAIDDFVGNVSELDSILPNVDLVKIDFERVDAQFVPMIVSVLRRRTAKLVAMNVETPEQFVQAKSLGIDLFQGFHFARPQVMSARRAKPSKLGLLRLMSLAMGEAETHQIEEEFKRHPALTINLLRLANSAAFGRRQNITSLRHALVLLGRRQLRIWLQLLLYTADQSEKGLASPLLQVAAARGKLMELVYQQRPGPESVMKELAFIAGILSLMDVVLEMPHASILEELNLPEPVRSALLRREGPLGTLLVLAEALERGDSKEVARTVKALGWVHEREVMHLQAEAFYWANQLAQVEKAAA